MKPKQPIIVDIGIKFDLRKLITTKLFLQSSSGGGKSWTIRKLAEVTVPHMQVIVIDVEGEFSNLREKFPFALIGNDGEIPLNTKYAKILAHKLMETGLSAIIDLSEMDPDERLRFGKVFFNALIESPKNLWHEMMVIIDEADFFAPEGKESECTSSVISLGSKGRKRGICMVLATQRLAKLKKSATADILNKMVGLTGLDIDRKRAAEELGLTSKEDIRNLLRIPPGEFYGIGPALGYELKRFKVSKTLTTHMEAGSYSAKSIPTPVAIKSILGKLRDIPEEAERELNTKKEYEAEIARLKNDLRAAKKGIPVVDNALYLKNIQLKNDLAASKSELQAEVKFSNKILNQYKIFGKQFTNLQEVIAKLYFNVPERDPANKPEQTKEIAVKQTSAVATYNNKSSGIVSTLSSGPGDLRILRAAAMYHPSPVSKVRIGALAGLVPRGGSFTTYMSKLRTIGHIEGTGDFISCTVPGFEYVNSNGGVPEMPDNLVEFWREIIGPNSGAGRMLSALKEAHPEGLTKEHLGEATQMVPRGGSWTTYMSKLNSNGLIVKSGNIIKLSPELFNE